MIKKRLEKQREFFEHLQKGKPTLTSSKFYSGREIKEGDIIYYGLLQVTSVREDLMPETEIILMSFHEEELDTLYKVSDYDNGKEVVLRLEKISLWSIIDKETKKDFK